MQGETVARIPALLIEKAAAKEAPGGSIVKVEVSVGAEVLAGKELSIRLGHQPNELFVGQLLELFWGDRASDSEFERFHGMHKRDSTAARRMMTLTGARPRRLAGAVRPLFRAQGLPSQWNLCSKRWTSGVSSSAAVTMKTRPAYKA